MPLYDVQCEDPGCGQVQEIFCCINSLSHTIISTRCNRCGGPVKQVMSKFGLGWFKPHINYDFDGTPIHVESKQHLKQLCKKFGVQSRALL